MDMSWEVLYWILCAPGILLAANFMFGSCTVADALEQRVAGAAKAHDRHRTIGRCSLIGVIVCTAWQYWECQFVLRHWNDDGTLRCNPVHAAYATVDGLSGWLAGVPATSSSVSQLWDCRPWEASYLLSLCVMMYFLWFCVTSSSQVGAAGPTTSYCRKCASHVLEMDHHCYFLHNCVGAKNREHFLALVISIGVVALHVLAKCSLAFVFSTWHSTLGYLVTIIVLVGALFLGVFQTLLLRKGLTTVQFLKQTKELTWLQAAISLL
jgi:hypothetical protein